MKVVLITLNYNGAEPTLGLVESVRNQLNENFSLIVVDNNSKDREYLRKGLSGIEHVSLIENEANLGFAAGNKSGVVQAFKNSADWVVLINNDTAVDSDFSNKLIEGLSGKTGLAGLPIQEESGDIAYSGRISWLKTPSRKDFHVYNPNEIVSDRYVIGAGMAISKEAFQQIGFMDEKYFLYFEDIDYSFRAQQAGIDTHYLRAPIVHHKLSTTTKKELGGPLLHRYHYRNALYFNFKNGSLITQILAVPWSVLIALHQIFKIVTRDNPKLSRAILSGVVDFYMEQMGHINTKKKIGIECEQIEGEMWGVGKIVLKTLENIGMRPELANDFEFHLYFKSEIPKLPFLDNPIFHKKIIEQPFKHKSFVLYYYLFLPVTLWFERLDFMFFPNYMLPVIFFGKSIVMLTEDIYYEMRSKQQKIQHRIAYRIFTTWAVWWASKIMAISETSKKELHRLFGIDPERIIVNHLAIDNPKSELNNDNGDYLLFVGQAFPRRHLKESLMAFEKLSSDFPNLKFIAVGPDKYNPPRIKTLLSDINKNLGSEKVIWYEHVPQEQLLKLYSHALATIYVSSREAFGLPPLEALAQGSIPIVADNPLGHELFGEAAIFVEKLHSVEAIATAMREAMTNTALREKIKGLAPQIANKYTWSAHTERFINLIKTITNYA
ncbi:MAG: glycosyltransferase [Candidatus Pacebacteria bacterium]|nr:glycosyltransferase [Candidatus Paceibacterota bacterium]